MEQCIHVGTQLVTIILFHLTSALHSQSIDTVKNRQYEPTKRELIAQYEATSSMLRSHVQAMAQLGIDITRPDVTQPGGGIGFQTYTSLKSTLEAQRNRLNLQSLLNDGWYRATVLYYNFNTHTSSKYELDVLVRKNKVIVIDFPNAGSLHTGRNNSEYTYVGGDLEFNYVLDGTICRAFTVVDIESKSARIQYRVLID